MKRLLVLLFLVCAAFAVFADDDAPLFPQPVVLANDIPDVAQCRGILRQEIVDIVRAAQEDPHDAFERWRQSQRTMMEESPVTECQSALWKALRRLQSGLTATTGVTVPSGTSGLNLRPDDAASQYAYQLLTASVGANVEPAGGVEAYQGEMQIAVNPNNPLQMVAGANSFYRDPAAACQSPTGGTAATYGTQALYGSSDGGATWTYKCAPWPSTLTGGVSGAVAWFGSDPAMAWDSQGRAYAVYMLISQNSSGSASGSAIVIARSTDSGQTWSNLGTIVNNINVSSPFHDKEFVAIDNGPGPSSSKSHPGRIYVIWDANNVERVAYSDNGTSWTTVVLPTPGVGSYDIGGDVKVAPDGTVYAIWNRLVYSGSTQSGERTVFSKSVDGGATWTTPIVIASQALLSFGSNNKPPAQETRGVNAFGSLGIDSNPASAYYGYLYFVYPDFPSGTTSGTNINIYLVRSTNDGTSWSTPVKVNDDAGTATQIFPWLSVDPTDGSVNVAWYDTRSDATNNRKTQFFYARSIDGGNTFESNILVTDSGSSVWNNAVNYSDENTTDNSGRNANQYGDYSGIVAQNRTVVPFWTDTRPYFPTADTVSPSRKEDAAAAVIVNCSVPNAVAAPVVTIDPSCSSPSVTVDWSAPSVWGTNATGGTYSVYRSTSSTFPAGSSPLATGLTATEYVDTTGLVGLTYYYFVTTKNNCPGTALTPMSANSTASNAVVFPACGQTFGNVSGTVTTSGGLPISGATVTAGARSTTTDGSGAYTLISLPTGTYSITASATGYNSSTVNNVVVSDGVTTTQNFTLSVVPASACLTDTTQSDFQAGTATNVDLTVSAGDVKLALSGSQAIDQQNTTLGTNGNGVTTTTWEAQTFTAGANGNLTRLDLAMFCSSCSGTTPNITIDIRTVSSGLPTTTILATTTIAGFSSGSTSYYTATFSSPAAITSGTVYALVARLAANPSTGTYATTRSNSNAYAGGAWIQTTTSGSSWTAQTQDLGFKVYITPSTYQTSGNLVSSLKDSAAVTGATTTWNTLSWTSVQPASTAIKFQAAASNSSSGPFSFVGPDGTAATFFTTSGASLSQFNGNRYLKYKAYLSTSNTAATPTLNDVAVCYDTAELLTTALAVSPASGTYGGTAALSATLTANGSPVSGQTITFTLNGSSFAGNTATTDANGTATLAAASLAGINAGSYPAGVGASFAASGSYSAASGTAALTVDKATPAVSVTGGTFTYDGNAHAATGSVTGVGGANLGSPTFTYTPGGATAPTNAGSYSVDGSFPGNANYNAATSASSATITIDKATPAVSVTGGTFTYDGNAHAATGSVTGVGGADLGTPTFTYTPGGATAPTNAGSYSVDGSFAGNANYDAATSTTSATITINKATPAVSVSGGTFTYDGNPHTTSGTVTGVNGEDLGSASITYTPSTPIDAGIYNAHASFAGNANYDAASDDATITINKATPVVNITGGTFPYDGNPHPATASATGVNGEDLGAVTITYTPGGATAPSDAGTYTATASYAGSANYNAGSNDATITISKLTATINVIGGTFTYDGNAHPATATATGVNGEDLGTVTITYTPGGASAPVDAGTYVVNAAFAGDDNYDANSGTGSITINKATPLVTATGGTFTYDGNPHTATATVTGVNGEDLGSATITYDPSTPVDAGTYTATASFAGNDNYNAASDDATITIDKATPVVSVTGGTYTYDGNTHPATGSVTGVGGADLGSPSFTYDPSTPINAGTYTATASFAGNANYNAASAPSSATIIIDKATPTVSVTGGTFTYDGNAHNATGSVTGVGGADLGAPSIAYDPTTPINAGVYTATATFAGNTNYNAASAPSPATITIDKAEATVVATGGTFTYDGNAHNATATVTGVNGEDLGAASITYTPSTPINAGSYTATASFAGNTNYNAASDDATITIDKAAPAINVTGGTFTYDGNAHNATATVTGVNGEDLGAAAITYTPSTPVNAGTYTATASFAGNANYNAGTNDGTITINKATPAVSATGGTFTFDGNAHAGIGSVTGIGGASIGSVTLTYTPGGATAPTNAGSYNVTANFAGDANYSAATSSPATITINKATPTVSATGGTFDYDGNAHPASGSATGIGGASIGSVTFTYTPGGATAPTNAGSYSATANFAGNTNYNAGTSSPATITINKVAPTVSVTGGTFTYDGNPHAATGTVTGVNGESLGTPSFTYNGSPTAPSAIGVYNVVGTYAGNTNYTSGSNTATLTIATASGCTTPIATPTATNGGPYCAGGTVALSTPIVSGATYAWSGPNGFTSALREPTLTNASASASGTYSVIVTVGSCSSSPGSTTVTVNALPPTPTISTTTPASFCTGGSVTLTSSSATGNQWYRNGSILGGQTGQTYVATTTGDYTVVVTNGSGCSSSASAAKQVTVTTPPTATISAPGTIASGTSGSASVADAGVGATYNWSITNGTITSGTGTRTIGFTAGAAGTLTLNVTVTNSGGCSDARSANVTVTTSSPSMTVTHVTPPNGPWLGGTPVTIAGTGFASGATVTFGGTAATSVVVVNATTITAVTPAHAGGTVNVVVTNTNTTSATLTGGFTYRPKRFDPNGDDVIDPADIFYLVNYLFTSGPQPRGESGMLSGDANGDDAVDPADIFYIVNHLFTGGPAPVGDSATTPSVSTHVESGTLSGAISFGKASRRDGHVFVPVVVTSTGTIEPHALALKLRIEGATTASIHRAGALRDAAPKFEITRGEDGALSYILSLDRALTSDSAVVAEIELGDAKPFAITIDPTVTMLADDSGTRAATTQRHTLQLGATEWNPQAQPAGERRPIQH